MTKELQYVCCLSFYCSISWTTSIIWVWSYVFQNIWYLWQILMILTYDLDLCKNCIIYWAMDVQCPYLYVQCLLQKMSGTHIFRKVIPIIRVKLITPHLRSALVITPSMSLLGDITVQFPGGTSRAGGGQCAWLYSSCCSNTTCWCGGVLFAEETKTKRNPCCSTAFQRVDEVVLSHHAKNQASEIQRIAKTWCNLNFTHDF